MSAGDYSPEEFCEAKRAILASMIANPVLGPSKNPKAVLLDGQSGAGKTALHGIYSEIFGHNAISVNGDEYRSKHPRYRELDTQYGPECVKYTAPWAGKMTESLIDTLSLMGYNLVIEGTLRTHEVPMKTAQLLKDRGYQVSLAIMAVKPEISLLSCQIRYELMRIAGTVPRATDPSRHNAIVHDIVSNLDYLEQSGMFDAIEIFDRSGDCLHNSIESEGLSAQALKQKLFGPWSPQERAHHTYLQNKLASLQE